MISNSVVCFALNVKLASEWHTVFYITAGVYLLGALVYALGASGERQPWAIPKPKYQLYTCL